MKAKIPENEGQRLRALRAYEILDTVPETVFDEIAQLASSVCSTPIAAISLIDSDRQWFKSSVGLNVSETSRDLAFCAHTILEKDVMVVPDALTDERFKGNDLVAESPNIRFYAGAQLVAYDGCHIGSLCVIDNKPRELTNDQILSLKVLASQVISNLELRLARKREQTLNRAMKFLSKSNWIMLHFESEQELFDQICHLSIDVGNYALAWIGITEGTTDKYLRPVAYRGRENGFIENYTDILSSTESSISPANLALRSGNRVISQNILHDKEMTPWHLLAKAHGFNASLSLPLIVDQEVFGVLTIYSEGINAFNDEEVNVLEELASNLSFGIKNLKVRNESKVFQNKLKKNEERYRLLLEAMEEGVVLQGKDSSILAFNKSTERILGLSADQIVGKTSLDSRWKSIHEDGSPFPGETHPVVVTLKTGIPQKNVVMGIHKPSGELTWISINVQPIFEHGDEKPDRVVATMHDITDQKRLEMIRTDLNAQIAQIQKMDSLGKMVGGIAHDFNNMLGSIIGYADLLKMQRPGEPELPERSLNYIRQINLAGNRAKELIAQMLIYSRPYDSNIKDAPKILLAPVIKEATQLLRSLVPSSIEISYEIKSDHLVASIAPVELHQVILNLVVNARDAIENIGRIDIKLEQKKDFGVCDSCHKSFSGRYAVLTVMDSGHGINSELINRIFEPFFTTKETGKGSGMGLSVVYGIVHRAQGHLKVRSEKGKGTEFLIFIPDDEGQPDMSQITQQAESISKTISGLSILVVDDDLSMAEMMSEFLTLQGIDVTAFTNPTEALEEFKKDPKRFDMAIMDEVMPELSGLALARSMLEIRSGFPILMCSGYSDRVNPVIAKQNGISGYMEKPMELTKVTDWIKGIGYRQS